MSVIAVSLNIKQAHVLPRETPGLATCKGPGRLDELISKTSVTRATIPSNLNGAGNQAFARTFRTKKRIELQVQARNSV